MPVTSTDIVNQAIMQIGNNQPLVTGVAPTFDTSPSGIAASKLYAPTVATVARQFGWDFARRTVVLTLSGNTPPFPWTVEYLYPTNGIEIWQLIPPSAGLDVNNPLPVNYDICNATVSAQQRKVIQCNLAGASAVYNNNPTEDTWDSLFREAVVRLLASGLAMAVEGRPDTAMAMLQSGAAFESMGEMRAD